MNVNQKIAKNTFFLFLVGATMFGCKDKSKQEKLQIADTQAQKATPVSNLNLLDADLLKELEKSNINITTINKENNGNCYIDGTIKNQPGNIQVVLSDNNKNKTYGLDEINEFEHDFSDINDESNNTIVLQWHRSKKNFVDFYTALPSTDADLHGGKVLQNPYSKKIKHTSGTFVSDVMKIKP